METISVNIEQGDVYEEVAKATDYTGSKLIDADADARDRILAVDEDFLELGRFWEEAVTGVNESLKEMLVSGRTVTTPTGSIGSSMRKYQGTIEVSVSFDKALTPSVESALRSYFIAAIIGQWFKFANKAEATDYFTQAGEFIEAARRLLYSRKKPTRPIGD